MFSMRAKRLFAGLAASLLMATALPAQGHADSATSLLDQAKNEASHNKPLAAVHSTQEALNRLWAASPVFLNQALFTKGKAGGFGIYDPRPTLAFSQTEPLYVYVEPAAYGFQATGALYHFGFVVDIAVIDANGNERGAAKGFTNFDYVSRASNKEISLIFEVDPLKLAPGNYGLKVTVHDKVKSMSVAKTLAFTIQP
jgi:hypothetical protein